MFAVFLPALNFRGNRSPYLWWFHKLLSELGEQAGYICGDEYFSDPARLFTEGRLDAGEKMAALYGYRIPDRSKLDSQLRADIPMSIWQTLESRYPSNPLAAFRHYCLEEDEYLYESIRDALDRLSATTGRLEAVITCVNCATLKKLCHAQGLPIIHLELGPLRLPAYLQTAYFDFSGVNGNTEAQSRFISSEIDDEYTVDKLRRIFMMPRTPYERQPDIDLGLSLQIEDDSNILCYANSHSSLSLMNNARNLLAERSISSPVLVRAHPSSYFALRDLPQGLKVDRSPTSVDFAIRCKMIHTVNSGLAVESLLLGRSALIHGDSPFAFCVDTETGCCKNSAFSFFILNYLVPWQIAFTPEYIRWRLNRHTEIEIRQLHMESFMQEKIRLLEIRVVELEQQLSKIQSSISWRLTYPLRAVYNLARRLHLRHRR